MTMALNAHDAIQTLRQHWGACFIECYPSVAAVSDQSSASRSYPDPRARRPKVYEAPTLLGALNAAISGEEIGDQE
jgi:hypothetical protein